MTFFKDNAHKGPVILDWRMASVMDNRRLDCNLYLVVEYSWKGENHD